ncbi:MAG: hypothetical protein AAB336_05510 [Acidobacteriota bacterium]
MKYLTLSLILFAALASQVSAQALLKDRKIPDDLVITIGLTANMQFGGYNRYKITSDGKVFYEEYSNLPPLNRNALELVGIGQKNIKKPKTPKLKDKLSKKQLKKIIAEIEKSNVLAINENEQCETIANHYTTRGISITVNGETKGIEEIELRCDNNESQRRKDFANLYDFISKELSGVKKTKLTK